MEDDLTEALLSSLLSLPLLSRERLGENGSIDRGGIFDIPPLNVTKERDLSETPLYEKGLL